MTKRQPLQSLPNSGNISTKIAGAEKNAEKPRKAFSVYSDRANPAEAHPGEFKVPTNQVVESKKRKGETLLARPAKAGRLQATACDGAVTPQVLERDIEEMVERKIEEALAARAMNDSSRDAPGEIISEQVKRRLDALEQRMYGDDDCGRLQTRALLTDVVERTRKIRSRKG